MLLKQQKKTAENVADQASKQGEKVKRQASDAGERAKSAAGDAGERAKSAASDAGERAKSAASDAGERAKSAAKDAQAQGEGFLDKVYSVLGDVKDSILETVGVASKHTADLTDQAKDKFDEVSGRAKKTAKQVKKDAEKSLDL